jgi:hypothetical protein
VSLTLNVDDLSIYRVIEQETTFLPAMEMLPGLTRDVLAENRGWMQGRSVEQARRVVHHRTLDLQHLELCHDAAIG